MYSQERKFVLTANDQMQVLEEIWGAGPQENTNTSTPKNEQGRTITALHSIKFAANSVQARGVYRAANFCETIYTNLESECGPRLRGSLAGLKSLIFQYADGLFEIDPEFKESIQSRQGEQILAPVETDQNDNLETICLQGKHSQASNVLKPLLSLVKSEGRRNALETLMAFDTKDQEEPAIIRVNQAPHIAVKFENLMGPVTNLVLNEARHNGKQVSISYATDFDELGLSMANRVQEFLETLCLHIVANGVPRKQSTQISLTGQGTESKYVFSVNWRGYDLGESSCEDERFKNSLEKLCSEDGDIEFQKLALETTAPQQAGRASLMQSLEVSFPRTRAKRTTTNTIFTFKPENVVDHTQGVAG